MITEAILRREALLQGEAGDSDMINSSRPPESKDKIHQNADGRASDFQLFNINSKDIQDIDEKLFRKLHKCENRRRSKNRR